MSRQTKIRLLVLAISCGGAITFCPPATNFAQAQSSQFAPIGATPTVADSIARQEDAAAAAEKAKMDAAGQYSAMIRQAGSVKTSVRQPVLFAVRGVGSRLVASFRADDGDIDVTTENPDISGGWRLVRITGLSAEIAYKKEKPVKAYLSGRRGESVSPQSVSPSAASPFYIPPPPLVNPK